MIDKIPARLKLLIDQYGTIFKNCIVFLKTSNVRRFDSLDPRLNKAEVFSFRHW
jgi:hypothetical protein